MPPAGPHSSIGDRAFGRRVPKFTNKGDLHCQMRTTVNGTVELCNWRICRGLRLGCQK